MEKIMDDFSLGLFTWQTILIISIVLWIYTLIDILKSSFKKNDKLIWILVVLFVPVLGPLLYIFFGRKQKLK